MKKGFLSKFFTGIAVKRLSAVEANLDRSNQHEFNGDKALKNIFGSVQGSEKKKFKAQFIYPSEKEGETLSVDGSLTWYDARDKHPTRSEYRLYFSSTPVSEISSERDLLIIGRQPDNTVSVIVAPSDSTIENQLLWLFGLSGINDSFSTVEFKDEKDIELGFGSHYILEELGLSYNEPDENYLEIMVRNFGESFPTTRIFSEFSRQTIPEVTSAENPDTALLSWMEREEILFRTFERHIVAERLKTGFGREGADVDGFISFSLSVQNRRKSRAGLALENHLEEVCREHSLKYSRGKETENRAKPDFIFPGIEQYQNSVFPENRLSMLGVKTTCKDRWRQVTTEANRVKHKHLLTLEPSISTGQTEEMKANFLQLVIPKELHSTYKPGQQKWLWKLTDFLTLAKENQQNSHK
jgi:hypothetical protein